MPITDNGNIKYRIPSKYIKRINFDFCKSLRNELQEIFNLPLSASAEDLSLISGTAGWNTAFGLACIKTDNKDIYNYYESLDWYDSDIFDELIFEKLIKNRMFLGCTLMDLVLSKVDCDNSEIFICDCCGKVFFKKDCVPLDYYAIYCKGCSNAHSNKSENSHANEYYQNGLKTLNDLKSTR